MLVICFLINYLIYSFNIHSENWKIDYISIGQCIQVLKHLLFHSETNENAFSFIHRSNFYMVGNGIDRFQASAETGSVALY